MINTPYTIIFIGPQGSGKGTQIELLTRVLREKDPTKRVVDIQTGRRFRALAAKMEGYTERRVHETLDSGMLQPLFLSAMLWGDAFHQHVDPECHLLIDGFPRTVHEAHVLESALSFYKRNHLIVLNLSADESIVRERMIKRARKDTCNDYSEGKHSKPCNMPNNCKTKQAACACDIKTYPRIFRHMDILILRYNTNPFSIFRVPKWMSPMNCW